MLRRFGDRSQFVDPADDFIAEGRDLRPSGYLLHRVHAFPIMNRAGRGGAAGSIHTSPVPAPWRIQSASRHPVSSLSRLGQPANAGSSAWTAPGGSPSAVSYTHLTLP